LAYLADCQRSTDCSKHDEKSCKTGQRLQWQVTHVMVSILGVFLASKSCQTTNKDNKQDNNKKTKQKIVKYL